MTLAEDLAADKYHDQAVIYDSPIVAALLAKRLGLLKPKNIGITVKNIKDATTYLPYLKDIWEGRGLLIHKPFDQMTEQEIAAYRQLGNSFYKNNLNGRTAENNMLHKPTPVNFPNARAGESDFQYMEQYPLLRRNIQEAKENTFLPPHVKIDKNGNEYIRPDANGFNNLKVNWKGKLYDYQIKENSNNSGNDFYNIKPYEYLLKY